MRRHAGCLRLLAVLASALLTAQSGAQAPAGQAVIQAPPASAGEKADTGERRRRNDPGALPPPLNSQLRGEGLKLPQGAESPLIITPPSGEAGSPPAAPETASKAGAGTR